VIRLLCLLLLAPLALASPATARAEDDAEELAELAVERQPSLEAMRERVQALQDVASVAGVWADPMLGAELSNLPVDGPLLTRHPMAGLQFKLQQMLPAPGVTRARVTAAEGRVDAAEAEIESLANTLRGEVRDRFWDLALVRRLRALTARHVAELDGMIAAVSARYEVGVASQHDLLQLQLRRDRLAEMLPDLDSRAERVQAVLNGALAREPSTAIATPKAWVEATLPLDAAGRRAAVEEHPEVRALRVRASALRAEADRARAEVAPDPTVWLGYRVRTPQANGDPGTNFVTAGVSVPLPVGSSRRWRAMADAADAKARAAEAAAEAKRVRLAATLEAAEAERDRAAARAESYADRLEPAARAALQSTLSAYQVDRAVFADLIRAEIALLEVQRQRLLAEAETARAHAVITTIVATPRTEGAD